MPERKGRESWFVTRGSERRAISAKIEIEYRKKKINDNEHARITNDESQVTDEGGGLKSYV